MLFQIIWNLYFHDIGKLKVKHENEMRFHPILGANLLKQIKLLNKIVPIVKYHHERYDGSGYPEGLKGEEIPIGSRILSLLEDYEEKWLKLRDILSQEKIKEEFLNKSRQIHDPKILKIFAKLKIYRNINLNKGKILDYIE
ncbi:MAG: HD domain-containing protein [Armatimonadetes bacterium]|nr:HD domain-containing protein [Armatimonadota bacterium]